MNNKIDTEIIYMPKTNFIQTMCQKNQYTELENELEKNAKVILLNLRKHCKLKRLKNMVKFEDDCKRFKWKF